MTKTNDKIRSLDELDDFFSFRVDGELYVMPVRTRAVMTPGWVRRNRRRNEVDYFMTLMENLAGQGDDEDDDLPELTAEEKQTGKAALKALDRAGWEDHRKAQEDLAKHVKVLLGE